MFLRTLLTTSALLLSFQAFGQNTEDYGECNAEARYLLSQGGAIEPIRSVQHDRKTLEAVYSHQYGNVETSYAPDWEKLTTPEARSEEVKKILGQFNEEQ